MPNYYQILGIPESASQSEIKSAYKKKAILFHPDKHAGDPEMEELFKEINSAYQTLSNPYNKSNYDLTLKYGSFRPTPTHQSPHSYNSPKYNYKQRPNRPNRPPVYSKRMGSKANIKATFYAFMFAFVMGLIVYSGIWTLEYIRAKDKAVFLAERRLTFQEAKDALQLNDVENSLKILSTFKFFDSTEGDIQKFKEKLLLKTLIKGNRNLKNGNFNEALVSFHILEPYPISSSLNFKLKVAKAYKGIGEFQKTLKIYEELFQGGYRTTSFYYEIGLTYQQGNDFTQALFFYKRAAEFAAEEYKSVLGEAYPIMITASHIPKLHYDIYMSLANAYYETKNFEQGLISLRWTKEIWPDSAMNYYISAKCHQALQEINLACADFNMAKFKNFSLDIPNLCN